MRAAVVHDLSHPLSLEDVPKPDPGGGEVVVKIEACGLLHTDIHAARPVGGAKEQPGPIPG